MADGAVIGGDAHFINSRSELVFPEEQILRFCADDGDDAVTGELEIAGDRIDWRNANAAANDDNGAIVFDLAGLAEWADNVRKCITRTHGHDFFRRKADRLDDDRHSACFSIVVGDSQRNAFIPFTDAHDQKLTGFRLFCKLRRFDDQFVGLAAEVFIIDNFIHFRTFFL